MCSLYLHLSCLILQYCQIRLSKVGTRLGATTSLSILVVACWLAAASLMSASERLDSAPQLTGSLRGDQLLVSFNLDATNAPDIQFGLANCLKTTVLYIVELRRFVRLWLDVPISSGIVRNTVDCDTPTLGRVAQRRINGQLVERRVGLNHAAARQFVTAFSHAPLFQERTPHADGTYVLSVRAVVRRSDGFDVTTGVLSETRVSLRR